MSEVNVNERDSQSAPRIKRQLVGFVAVCTALLLLAAALSCIMVAESGTATQLRSQIVELNELAQNPPTDASSQGDLSQNQSIQNQLTQNQPTQNQFSQNQADAIAVAQDALRQASQTDHRAALTAILLMLIVALVCMVSLSVYLYISVVRPFSKLQNFAEEVASGNLDLPLEYERSNPFGKFAWAFDHMRSELKRARLNEREAISANKTAIASLAHDLRTPVASIRAYSEALGMGLAYTDEEFQEYVEVIGRKCGEVSQLVDDMLTHALVELDRMHVECDVLPVLPFLQQRASGFGLVEVSLVDVEDAYIFADELRLRQAIENVLVNASKYATASHVEISGSSIDGDLYRIAIRDFGEGMDSVDIPFAFDRFYRGANVGEIQGSGLGLFVVRYVVERMGGRTMLENARPGLIVYLDIPLVTA